MPTEEEFHKIWDDIQDFVERLGDECEDPTSNTPWDLGEPEDPGETYAMSCTSTELDYHIVGNDEYEHFSVVHRYDFRREISSRLNDQDAVSFIENSDYNVTFSENKEGHIIANVAVEEEEEIQIDSEHTELESYGEVPDDLLKLLAADLVLEDIDVDLMEELKFRLRDRISSPHTYHSLLPTGKTAFYGFIVGSDFFPFEPDFGIDDLHHAWIQTTNVANLGTRYLTHSFNLEREEEKGLIDIGFQEDRIRISG